MIWGNEAVSDPFAELIEVLHREAARYRELAKLAGEQKEVLISGKLESLPGNVKRQEKEMFALGPLGDERMKALKTAALALRISKPTLQEVTDRCPVESREALKSAVREVVEAARALDAGNKGNAKLLENAVSYVNFTLEALQGKGAGKTPTYRSDTTARPTVNGPEKSGTQWSA